MINSLMVGVALSLVATGWAVAQDKGTVGVSMPTKTSAR